MKRTLLFSMILCLALIRSAVAQENKTNFVNMSAADDHILQQKTAANPTILDQYLIYEKNFKQLVDQVKFEKDNTKTDTLINGKRIIPVVFHIIHHAGQENISKAQVLDAIHWLNIDYNKQNADTSDTYSLFQSRAANCQIEFRLAKIDPNGNCTDGIDRIYDPQTNYAYFSTMHQYNWNPYKYMNVYSVNFIYPSGMSLPDGAFIGGMSPFPPSNTLSQALTGGDTLVDGVLIRQDCIGTIGTATTLGGMPINAMNRTFTHESGHYFNLYHPFQSLYASLGIDGCGLPPIFIAGDEVDDTPSEAAAAQNTSLSCFTPGSKNTCSANEPSYGNTNAPDMIENYMDYQWGFCNNIFTINQLDRINACMQADRKHLWSKENLIETGTLDTTTILCGPLADFYPNKYMVCAGGSVTFTDFSYSGAAQNWEWTFAGGTPAASTVQNPTIQYNTPGTYPVKLKVTNIAGNDSLIKNNLIVVINDSISQLAPFVEGFETANFATNWYLNNDNGNPWEITDSAFYSGSKSMRIANFYNNAAGSTDEIITPAYNLTALPTGGQAVMKFQLAYAGKIIPAALLTPADTAYDGLKIYVSTDCGGTWTQKYSKSNAALTTCNPTASNYIPSSTADWRQETVILPGLFTADNVRFKFVFKSNGGNNLYVDDINITATNVGIQEDLLSDLNFSIRPNPVDESALISFNLDKSNFVKITIYNVVGQEVLNLLNSNLSAGSHSYSVQRTELGSAGVYFVKTTVGNQTMTKKLIVK